MSTKRHADGPAVETMPAKRVMTPMKDAVLGVAVAVPQLVLLLTYHRGSKDDLLGVAMFGAFVASFLGFFLVEVWRMYEGAQRRGEHFRDRAEMLYIEARGFAFSHGFVVSEEIEEFVRNLLPSDDEARRYHSGLACGIGEARDPETYRVARSEAEQETRFYLADHGLSNRVVGVAPPSTPTTEKP